MVDARMTPHELLGWHRMSGMSRVAFARALNVTSRSLLKMETGRESIPARFDDEVESVVDAALPDDDSSEE